MTGRRRFNVYVPFVDMLLAVLAAVIVLVSVHKKQEGVKTPAEYIMAIEWDRMVDADVDLVARAPPDDAFVYYNSREHGALALDRDSRGFLDDRIRGEDGNYTYLPHRETMTVRGIVPGEYQFGIHLYQARNEKGSPVADKTVAVHAELIKVNPVATVIYSSDTTLTHVGDAANLATLDVSADGAYALVDNPVDPIANRLYGMLGEANRQSGVPPGESMPAHPATVP